MRLQSLSSKLLSSQFAWVSVSSSSNLLLKHVYMNFPKLSIVCMYEKSHYIFYYRLLKLTDLINLENAWEYFAIKSLLVVGQVPPMDFIWCSKVFLWNSSIFKSYINCSDDCTPSSQGHIGLSINLNLWRYDFVFPWPETIAVNSDVFGIFYLFGCEVQLYCTCTCHEGLQGK